MRWTATGLLLAMGVLFFTTHGLVPAHPAWGYVNAFAEAAMVGGLADWFAVTALFRHPLGLPIPHTAIIPSNKDRIADTMAQFLQENFLTPAVVARRMSGMNVARAIGDFLVVSPDDQGADNRSRITGGAAELLAEVLESLDPDRLGNQVRAGLGRQLGKIDVSPLAGRMLENTMADQRHLPLINGFVRWAGLTLEDNEETVRSIIHERVNGVLRWAGLDKTISSNVLDGLYKLLAEVLVDPEHPIRGKIEEGLKKLAFDLQNDPETRARVEDMKSDLLENPAVAEWWMGVWERIRQSLIRRARDPNSELGNDMRVGLSDLGEALKQDPRLQTQINRFARRTAVGIATRYGSEIVTLVSETVKRWDATTITGRIESAVGRDLQFIRVNGTIVGGLVGMTLHFIVSFL
ncbi:membrane protein [Erythrobacter longus]|uniref:Membrane protein n=2 Tax=Erythrobacter longus TaxID=1044 RepID=A0A074M4E2_ERYLO|nr:membrane protein [Erythrobacter longus]